MKKLIKGYEDYSISDTGIVTNERTCKELSKFKDGRGYHNVALYSPKKKQLGVHRLVATAFIPNPQKLPHAHHIDEDKTNNNVSNLAWISAKDNTNAGTRNKRASLAQTNGKQSKPVKLWNDTEILRFPSRAEAIRYGFHNIDKVLSGKNKRVKGYKARYV